MTNGSTNGLKGIRRDLKYYKYLSLRIFIRKKMTNEKKLEIAFLAFTKVDFFST